MVVGWPLKGFDKKLGGSLARGLARGQGDDLRGMGPLMAFALIDGDKTKIVGPRKQKGKPKLSQWRVFFYLF